VGIFSCKTGTDSEKVQPPPVKKEEVVPAPVSQELEIILSFVSGDVYSGKKLSTGDKLPKGSMISTSAQSLADIQPIFPGLSASIRIKENSEITISDRKNDKENEIIILVKKGEASFNSETVKEGQSITIMTPVISATMKSHTKFGLTVNKDGDTKLEVYEGKATCRLAVKEEYEKFPLDINENIPLKAFISKELDTVHSELNKGDKLTITLKQRDDFVKKKRNK
jgi:hypothetical protein